MVGRQSVFMLLCSSSKQSHETMMFWHYWSTSCFACGGSWGDGKGFLSWLAALSTQLQWYVLDLRLSGGESRFPPFWPTGNISSQDGSVLWHLGFIPGGPPENLLLHSSVVDFWSIWFLVWKPALFLIPRVVSVSYMECRWKQLLSLW